MEQRSRKLPCRSRRRRRKSGEVIRRRVADSESVPRTPVPSTRRCECGSARLFTRKARPDVLPYGQERAIHNGAWEDSVSEKSNHEVAERYAKAHVDHDYDAMDELRHADARHAKELRSRPNASRASVVGANPSADLTCLEQPSRLRRPLESLTSWARARGDLRRSCSVLRVRRGPAG